LLLLPHRQMELHLVFQVGRHAAALEQDAQPQPCVGESFSERSSFQAGSIIREIAADILRQRAVSSAR
jgi:hypothetical protein